MTFRQGSVWVVRPPPSKAREAALDIVEQVFAGRSLSSALPEVFRHMPDTRERALCQEISYGVFRWWPRLGACLDGLLERPLRERDADIRAAIFIGLYQLGYTRVPAHAAVKETVALSQYCGKPWAKGLINAVLRRFQREGDALLSRADRDEAAAVAHPRWLTRALRDAWPDQWRRIADENNRRPPLSLRVNSRKLSREGYLQTLAEAGFSATAHPHTPEGIILEKPVPVDELPGFAEGLVSVQDGAGQLAAHLLAAKAGERVLDACAAPGGKTTHLLEQQPELDEVVALDIDEERLQLVQENCSRLGLAANLVRADARKTDTWWDGRPFDRVLLDAPCTATGVIRRQPDIKFHRRAKDVPALAAKQEELLDALWGVLAPGGTLLYATCSVLPQENQQQMRSFLSRRPDASERQLKATWGLEVEFGRQILPGTDSMDGFYYALLEKH
ncbi:MAG: 16S rRNA (cytosine(967)-C(5))-methyltransferase [Gammaproteobacteria bacterium]|nr:MAG: 16S rRNA (cytosine(967)-C(5))-methyltransferase [Gammaproteobacteria bacterium]